MFIDFLGDKAGARLDYCGQYALTDGETLETVKTTHDIPNMYACEDRAFIDSCNSGDYTRSNIEFVLESAKLLQALYDSAEQHKEITF